MLDKETFILDEEKLFVDCPSYLLYLKEHLSEELLKDVL